MSTPMICKVKDCGRTANTPGSARGYCPRCYSRERRGKIENTRPQAPVGESTEIAFRLLVSERTRAEAAAATLGITLSDLCRAALRGVVERHESKAAQAEIVRGLIARRHACEASK